MTDTAPSEQEDQQEDPSDSGRTRRWRRWVLGSFAATVPVAVALYTLAWTEHSTLVHDFRAAQSECLDSVSDLVGTMYEAQLVATRNAFQPPPAVAEDSQAALLNGINTVQRVCFAEPYLDAVVTDDLGDGWAIAKYAMQGAWVSRDMASRESGKSSEQVMLDDASKYLADELSPAVHRAKPPTLWESTKGFIGD